MIRFQSGTDFIIAAEWALLPTTSASPLESAAAAAASDATVSALRSACATSPLKYQRMATEMTIPNAATANAG